MRQSHRTRVANHWLISRLRSPVGDVVTVGAEGTRVTTDVDAARYQIEQTQ